MAEQNDAIALLLAQWQQGDLQARETLFERLYEELKRLSAVLLRQEASVSLSPGDVVNEAIIRLINLNSIEWSDKSHFMALAARMMRRVLIEHARQKQAQKREHQKVTLVTNLPEEHHASLELLQIDSALSQLESINSRYAEIVEMRYFAGMSLEEIAQVSNSSVSTVQRSWRAARAWLRKALDEPDA